MINASMMVDPRTLFRPRQVGGAVTAAYFLVASHAFLYLTVAAAYFLVASHALYSGDATSPAKLLSF